MSAEQLLTDLDRQTIAVSKALAADAVEKAGSGHPGTPISLAGVAWLLYQREMVHDPADPGWLGRDRFVLSIGHASRVQYIQLSLAGYDIDLEGFTAFRSPAGLPGHPEFGEVPGVETTTGPLGAGFANAVGLAMAARREHGLLDAGTPLSESVFDHFVYTVLGDGCMQEGVSSEAASLAGTQQLGNLIAIYDDNDITIEGNTDLAFTEDVSARFAAYGWQVIEVDWRAGDRYEEDLEALRELVAANMIPGGDLERLDALLAEVDEDDSDDWNEWEPQLPDAPAASGADSDEKDDEDEETEETGRHRADLLAAARAVEGSARTREGEAGIL
mgnify:CR=1 FL=1